MCCSQSRASLGGWLFGLRLVGLLGGVFEHHLADGPKGVADRGARDQLDDLSFLPFELLVIELNSLAPLADFGPVKDTLEGDPQLLRLVAALAWKVDAHRCSVDGLPSWVSFANPVE